ncbi:MAG: hypothetical protein JW841_10290 [Deltaproteobacteria bacterium]|nr:hypothetical protein [Deltaproteobacteria bacterium]
MIKSATTSKILIILIYFVPLFFNIASVKSSTTNSTNKAAQKHYKFITLLNLEKGPVQLDINNDGKPDIIRVKKSKLSNPKFFNETYEIVDGTTNKIQTIFKTKVSIYIWTHGMVKAIDIGQDGLIDFIYHAGDDTGDEWVILINQGSQFKAIYNGFLSSYFTSMSSDSLSYVDAEHSIPIIIWDSQNQIFNSQKFGWCTASNVKVHQKPAIASDKIDTAVFATVFEYLDTSDQNCTIEAKNYPWIHVRTIWDSAEEIDGYICGKYFSQSSPFRYFK